jgi:hypothetical protein
MLLWGSISGAIRLIKELKILAKNKAFLEKRQCLYTKSFKMRRGGKGTNLTAAGCPRRGSLKDDVY